MEYRYTYKVGTLPEEDREFYERVNPGYQVTGETLEEHYEEVSGLEVGSTTYVVMKGGNYTPYGMCRDLGDYYIIARFDRHDRIDKGTLNRTVDVADR